MITKTADLRGLRAAYSAFIVERARLVNEITHFIRLGIPAANIYFVVSGTFKLDVLEEYCSQVRLFDTARAVLCAAGLGDQVSLGAPSIHSLRAVYISLAADPDEYDGYEQLPARIREALSEHQIMLEGLDAPNDDPGSLLLEGYGVRLVGGPKQ